MPSPQYLDWFVLTSKAAAMQRLADLVRTGHRWYVHGTIPREKAGYFAAKQEQRYRVGQDRCAASRQRKAGQATFRLIMLHQENTPDLYWWLLRTDGVVPDDATREKWRDAITDRIKFMGYELVRHTRAGQAAPAWTWRYTKSQEQYLREAIIRAIRNRRDDHLRQLIHTIWKTPGFAGARQQVKRFRKLILAECKRSSYPPPELPARIGYVRRLPDLGRRLSELGVKQRAIRRSRITCNGTTKEYNHGKFGD